AADRVLALDHQRIRPRRQVYINPAAEADQAVARTRARRLAIDQVAADAPGDQARDLHHRYRLAAGQVDAHRHPLVVLARLVEGGVEELAGAVRQRPHQPVDRDALDVNVED